MTIVKHSKDLNSLPLRKKRFHYWIKNFRIIIPTIILAVLIGTYLDLFFVGKGLYSFPIRPLPSIFQINIVFPLIGLPLLVSLFLYVCEKLNGSRKIMLILFISLMMAVFEKFSETIGFFIHQDDWSHIYSFIGYISYLSIILLFHKNISVR